MRSVAALVLSALVVCGPSSAQETPPLENVAPTTIDDLISAAGAPVDPGADGLPVPNLDHGQDGIFLSSEPEPNVQPFEPPLRRREDVLAALPDWDSIDYAYGAFQRGYYLTALSIATELASKGDAKAKTLIGYLYANGLGVPEDPSEAAIWYELAAEAGDAAAEVELANLYAVGLGVERDQKRAHALLDSAFKAGRTEAAYGLGLIYLDPKSELHDLTKAADAFRVAADAGNVDALYALATMYVEGQGVEKNAPEAARLMGQAARSGHIGAQIEYAVMLFNGQGVPVSEDTAAEWFRTAALAGNPVAQGRLARLYATGRGVPRDLAQAAELYGRAKESGLSDPWLEDLLGAPPGLAPALPAP